MFSLGKVGPGKNFFQNKDKIVGSKNSFFKGIKRILYSGAFTNKYFKKDKKTQYLHTFVVNKCRICEACNAPML